MTDDVKALAERIRSRSVSDGECLIWTGAKTKKGYGTIWNGERNILTHRAMFEASKYSIPDGMQIDHLCRRTSCCNPQHLECVTPGENTRRGNAGLYRKAEAFMITHCPVGHEYTKENTYVSKLNKRFCRICTNARTRLIKEKQRTIRDGNAPARP